MKNLKNRKAYLESLNENKGPGMVLYTEEDFKRSAKKIAFSITYVNNKSPFFSVLIKKLMIVPSIFVPTMATDGNAIIYNPKFTLELTMQECNFVIQHEILHCALLHFTRLEGRDRKLWNEATDYVINYMLTEMNEADRKEVVNGRERENDIFAILPKGGLYDKRFADMKSEDVYDILKKEGSKNPDTKTGKQAPPKCNTCNGSGKNPNQQNQQGNQDGQDGQQSQDGNQQGNQDGQDGQDGNQQSQDGNQQGHQGQQSDACPSCGGSGSNKGGQPGQGVQGGQGDQSQPLDPSKVGPDAPDNYGVVPGESWDMGGVMSPDQMKKYYDDPENPNGADQKKLEEGWHTELKKAAKEAGNMPGNIKRMIFDVIEPVINWRSQLKRFINAFAKKSRYKIPNRRFAHTGKYLPALKNSLDGITNIIVGIDTSGSVDDKLLQTFISEVYDILKTFEPERTDLVYIDSEVRSVDTILKKGKPDKDKAKGGGGTAFEPLFKWIGENYKKDKDISVVLYFTDLYGDTSFKKPKYHDKVIWVLEKDSRHLKVPWGKKLVLDKNWVQSKEGKK